MRTIRQFLLLSFSCLFFVPAFCQDGLGTWNIFNIKYLINEKWGLFGEGQVRSLQFYDEFHYHEIKAGILYTLDNNFTFALAGGKYDTYSAGGDFEEPKTSDEVRLFEQMMMSQNLRHINFEHRYRVEQRFTTNGFRNRFRYRFQFTLPLLKLEAEPRAIELVASGEIFFTNRPQYFERLRSFAGLAFPISNTLTFESGYMHQFDYNLVDETGTDFLLIALILEIRP